MPPFFVARSLVPLFVVLACQRPPDIPSATPEAAEPSPLEAMTLAPRPDWADKYSGSAPDERFFDIQALMDEYQLDRALAVELQNHFRDLTRHEPSGDRDTQFAEALRRVQAGIFEDGRDPKRLASAPFIVVFDLDDTLYDQSIRLPQNIEGDCADFSATHPGGKTRQVKLNPGWADAIHRIAALGGEVVIFSANVDEVCLANARAWILDGVPIDKHPAVAAFLTNSHLSLQPKQSGDPVVEPSKDLRIFDPDLSRTIIVDDNPRRLFQFRNTRVFRKFDADRYCATTDPELKHADDRALGVVVDEIEDALQYMKAHPDTSFADAYLPYTTLGRIAVNWLRNGDERDEAAAIAELRAHPELADEDF